MTLGADEQRAFARDGYFVRSGLIDDAIVDALLGRLSQLIERCAAEHLGGRRPSLDPWTILRDSQHDASVMWDPTRGSMPTDPREWEPLAMRVGHGLHLVDPLFAALARRPDVGGTLAQLIVDEPVVAHSAVIYKQPRSELVQFGGHQDAAYITTEPESLVLAFVALDDMDADNGALEVAPGSHHDPVHVQLELGDQGFVPVTGAAPKESDYQLKLLPMRRGSVAFVHGRTLHASGPNRSDRRRRALIIHAISRTARLADWCWLRPPPQGFVPLTPGSSSGSSST